MNIQKGVELSDSNIVRKKYFLRTEGNKTALQKKRSLTPQPCRIGHKLASVVCVRTATERWNTEVKRAKEEKMRKKTPRKHYENWSR
jgi:hypothetical protein